MDSEVNGLILAGGHSRRMGTDKSVLHHHGMPQREFLFQLLKKYCADVFVSCRRDQQVPSTLNPLFDNLELAGPLNGILSAFVYKNTSWLAIAVDMPFVDAPAIETLLVNRDQKKIATCYYNPETQQPEPLLTLWESGAYPYLMAFAQAGNISPREFLKTHAVNMITPKDDRILKNVNSPGDLS